MGGTRRVPNDPRRRERILDAALDVIAANGVHRTTHRRIAERAGVPLGSLTYYFGGLDELLEQAFARLSEHMSQWYQAALDGARDQDEACEAVADLICGQEYVSSRETVLIIEMYSYAQHSPGVAALGRQWLLRSRNSLSAHFSEPACRAIDALIEGWPIHRAFDEGPPDRATVLAAVRAIARHVR
ncbi:TetR/AcrR family transcriptional regulator [Streptomyces sp. CRN 30]|uniref:TetR/AcrR family transcriptional regulator n=1 Tax=Streptomyces sp. CRN 30 TaxID=3075613 RepID=UPI002A82ADB0|nr:TetR family transcriptional regulator [Streptomyces sp. CRN 30]